MKYDRMNDDYIVYSENLTEHPDGTMTLDRCSDKALGLRLEVDDFVIPKANFAQIMAATGKFLERINSDIKLTL